MAVLLVGAAVAGVLAARSSSHRDPLCGTLKRQADAAPSVVDGSGLRTAVLGDSWVTGYGLDQPLESYAYQLSRVSAWHATIDGWPGTGYTNGGACGGQKFADRIDAIPADAALVVLQGGLNDVRHVDRLEAAAIATVTAIHARAPRAAVIVVGVPHTRVTPDPMQGMVDSALSQAAARTFARFVPIVDWNLELQGDGVHMTFAGHQALAVRLAGVVAELVPPTAAP